MKVLHTSRQVGEVGKDMEIAIDDDEGRAEGSAITKQDRKGKKRAVSQG